MSSGKCVDGTGATSPLQRTCEWCSNCSLGEYKLGVCLGTDVFDLIDNCGSCDACPAGSYLKRVCDGTGYLGSFPGTNVVLQFG